MTRRRWALKQCVVTVYARQVNNAMTRRALLRDAKPIAPTSSRHARLALGPMLANAPTTVAASQPVVRATATSHKATLGQPAQSASPGTFLIRLPTAVCSISLLRPQRHRLHLLLFPRIKLSSRVVSVASLQLSSTQTPKRRTRACSLQNWVSTRTILPLATSLPLRRVADGLPRLG